MGELQKDWIDKLYEEGLSTRKISEMAGVSHATIQRWLVTDGIALRPKFKGGTVYNQGHVRCLYRGHRRADHDGYVPRSILVWEEANGVPFPADKEPHHKNFIPDDDRPDNIEPLTHAEHSNLHATFRHKKERQFGRETT